MRANPEQQISTFCALCVSRCGAVATVKDGRLHSLRPDPAHPTGKALCLKGMAAPELVYSEQRLRTPLRRTRPKGDTDPGFVPIGWDEALEVTAARLKELAREHGPESVVFASASPSTSAMSDSLHWVQRLQHAFGSPNLFVSLELCGWGRYFATRFTYGDSVPGYYLPDLERAGAILYWGYNPAVARLCHATATVDALQRGARLVVVDPRRAGLAQRADEWLRVRPGADGALALSLCHVLIERGWFDRDFVRDWTNGPLLVRADNGRLLRAQELSPGADADHYVAWDEALGRPITYDPLRGAYDPAGAERALLGAFDVPTASGRVTCKPAFQLVADECRRHAPSRAESICGVSAEQIERTARLLWESRPVAYYAWSGVEQHADATQIARAIGQLYALTGSLDSPGGNVRFPAVGSNPVAGYELLSDSQRVKSLGLLRRPLGPSRWEFVTSDDLYTALLDAKPYRVRGLVGFGANLLLAQADSRRGRDALARLDFYVHADLFMNPTAQLADIVLPVASPFETEALALGFDVSLDAAARVQLRRPLVAPREQARSDTSIVFDLATRLGLGAQFWHGDVEAAYRHQLEPSGVALEALREDPAGVDIPLETRHRKFAELADGVARGFDTPTRKIELYSETLLLHGYPPVPEFRGAALSFADRPELARRYPLTLTCAKSTWYCESQQRALPSLRKSAPDPQLELHPDAASARGIAQGDWLRIETPHGSVRARAKLNGSLHPDVVCGQHGWWQACAELDAPGYDPFEPDGANLNLVVAHEPSDPISGSVPHRSYLCQVVRCEAPR